MNDTPLDQWLATRIAELHDNLDDVLDLDAGLADARLPNLHTTLVRSLGDVLDVDAGLAHILQPSPPSDSMPSTPQTALGRFAIEFSARPLHERLATRTWFPQRELANARSLARLVRYTKALAGNLDLARKLAEADSRRRARVLADVRARVRHLAGRCPLDVAHAHIRAHIGRLADALEWDHSDRRVIVRARVGVANLAVALEMDLDNAFFNALEATMAEDPALAHALNHGRGLALTHNVHLVGELIDAVDRLEQALTNVMGADLTQLDLQGIPLDGLRWSTGTRWPPEWTEEVRSNSVELEPGLYEIRYGGVDALEYQAGQYW